MRRFLPFCFISFLPVCAEAAWRVELRPLEKAPYARVITPMVVVDEGTGLSRIEGAGVELKGAATEVFAIALAADPRPRTFEFQIGYLATAEVIDKNAVCAVSVIVDTGAATPQRIEQKIPLRTIHPKAYTVEELSSHFDFLMPDFALAIAGASQLKVQVQKTGACAAGRLLFFDPKLWRKEDATPAKPMVIAATDSLSADWFSLPTHYMPALEKFFSAPDAAFSTEVISAGTNTRDTTNVVSKMQFAWREFAESPQGPRGGLVPSFLDAGYDVISFNSNLLLSTAFQPSGIRNLYNLDVSGSEVNERNPEIMTALTLDWMARHADHDALFFLWFDATHVYGPAPRTRPGFDWQDLPYAVPEPNRGIIARQAKAMTYVDLVFEKFVNAPELRDADFVFFSDHGINYDTLNHPTPLWGVCAPYKTTANWHVAPVEVRIPAGMLIHGKHIVKPRFEVGLLDWIRTAVQLHDPRIDTSAWQGRALSSLSARSPLITLSHDQHGSVRINRRHTLFAEKHCEANGGDGFVLNQDQSPASNDVAEEVIGALPPSVLLPGRAIGIDLVSGRSDCQVTVSPGLSRLPNGALSADLQFTTPKDWYHHIDLYLSGIFSQRIAASISVTAEPKGCATVATRYVSRTINERFVLSSDWLGLAQQRAASLPPEDSATVFLFSDDTRYIFEPQGFVPFQPNEKKGAEIGNELRAAMKKWGYIQDDDK